MDKEMRIAIFCVGNKLMGDDGLGSVVYGQLELYSYCPQVDIFDLGCLTLDRINDVNYYDYIISVDALDATGEEVGTIFQFNPQDVAQRAFGTQSLHDLKLSDLFTSAELLGYSASGTCFGMQVENAHPQEVCIGLSEAVENKLPDLVDCVLAKLINLGCTITLSATGEQVKPGFHHCYQKNISDF